MNRQIARLFLGFSLMFAVLVAFTSRWSVFEANALHDKTANRRPLLEQQQIPRGLILASDGRTRLAENRRIGKGQTKRYYRVYPQGSVFSHPVGYAFISRGSAGLEKSYNDELSGNESEFTTLMDELRGIRKEGDDLQTTLDVGGQRAALAGLAGRKGAVVAIEPQTGAVRVMAALPSYDANQIPQRYSQLNRDPNSPLFNRTTQSGYPPGSTFKVVTAAAALDTGKYSPGSMISGKNNKPVSGVPLQNFGGENFGLVTLTDALTNSINTVFGEIGEKLGKQTMYRYMRRFGFSKKPELDYPKEQMRASGVYDPKTGRLLNENDNVDIGRVAIGQERLNVTPLQMAEVAAAVANGGKLMKPHLVDRVIRPDGRVRKRIRPRQQERVMSGDKARELTQMMAKVVEEGSGTAAALRGIRVAGKTGTAEVDSGGSNQAWFICFAPLDNPRLAVAVTIERTQQTGGEAAAPVAKQVLQEMLGGG
jgi:peptidoglycan glycosyltransferase